MNHWQPVGVVPTQLTDGAIEALTCIYVARIACMDPNDVVLGDYEHACVLVAQAEVACCQEAGEWPQLFFSGPPLQIEVTALPALRRYPPHDSPPV